jgi:HD-GYP domain-containing protein (c-di-GMP phosphodiesterase class II)
MFQFTSSLRVRVLLIILLAILPAFALFHLANQEERNSEINSVKQEILRLAELVASQEKEFLDGTRQLLIAISQFDKVRHYDSDECDQIISSLLSHFNRYSNFGVANAEGEVVCSALPLTERVNIADRKYFMEALNAQDFSIGEYQVGRITHRISINLGYPVYGDNGKLTGVVFAALDLAQLCQFEEKISSKIPESSILTKIDQNGIVLVRVPDGENFVGSQPPETSVVAEALRKNEGIVEAIGTDGHPWVYAFVVIKSNIYQDDLHLILGQPTEILLTDVNHMFNRNLLIMTVVGIVLLVGTWYGFDFSFVRQIQSLLHVTQRLTNGDLEARYPKLSYGNSEINYLGDSFNQMAASLEQRESDLLQAYDTTIEGWSRALDLRDKETEGHSTRVTELTLKLARMAGMGETELVHVKRGALLHDIGKLGIPDYILQKPDKLTDEEWEIMRQHPQYAYDMLVLVEYLRPALDIPYYHHEKWDGSGYPRGLKAEQIPLAARLFAIVDVWDALRSDRPYRAGWPKEKALEHIRSLAGTHFDPKAVELFLRLISENAHEYNQSAG